MLEFQFSCVVIMYVSIHALHWSAPLTGVFGSSLQMCPVLWAWSSSQLPPCVCSAPLQEPLPCWTRHPLQAVPGPHCLELYVCISLTTYKKMHLTRKLNFPFWQRYRYNRHPKKKKLNVMLESFIVFGGSCFRTAAFSPNIFWAIRFPFRLNYLSPLCVPGMYTLRQDSLKDSSLIVLGKPNDTQMTVLEWAKNGVESNKAITLIAWVWEAHIFYDFMFFHK